MTSIKGLLPRVAVPAAITVTLITALSTGVNAGMESAQPHPLMLGVPGTPFENTIYGTALDGTVAVTVDGLPATIVGTPSATELVIRLPQELSLPQPAHAAPYRVCRVTSKTMGGGSEQECAMVAISGDRPTMLPPSPLYGFNPPVHLFQTSMCEGKLYAISNMGLVIMDVSVDGAPQLLSTLAIEGTARRLTRHGTLLSLYTDEGDLLFIDAANPYEPVVRDVLPIGDMNNVGGNDRHVFAINEAELVAIDVSARPRPQVVSVLPTELLSDEPSFLFWVDVDRHFLYVTSIAGYAPGPATIVDMSVPASPQILESRGVSGPRDFYGDYVFSNFSGDVDPVEQDDFGEYTTEPWGTLLEIGPRAGFGRPEVSGFLTSRTGIGGGSLAASESYVFTGAGEIIDIRDVENPAYGAILNTRGEPIVSGDRLFLIGNDVAVFDVSSLPGFVARDPACGPTPLLVELQDFSAEAGDAGTLLRWTTATEVDNAGFRVLRSHAKSAPEVISGWIPARGNELAGADYEYLDRVGGAIRNVRYYLEDIDTFGKITRHGPVTVQHGVRSRPRGRTASHR